MPTWQGAARPDEPENSPFEPGLTSVIVTSYNTRAILEDCLQHLLRWTDVPFELIVVDDASADGTREYLEGLSLRGGHLVRLVPVLHPESSGNAAAIAGALPLCRGEYVAFLNADVVVTPRWLPRLIAHVDGDPAAGAVGPLMATTPERYAALVGEPIFFGQEYPGVYDDLEFQYPPDGPLVAFARRLRRSFPGDFTEAKVLTSACLLLHRTVLDEVGGPDPGFRLAGEDWDLSLRVRIAGYKLYIAEDVFVHHRIHSSRGSLNPEFRERWEKADRQRLAARWERLCGGRLKPDGRRPVLFQDLFTNERPLLFSDLRRGRRAALGGPWHGSRIYSGARREGEP